MLLPNQFRQCLVRTRRRNLLKEYPLYLEEQQQYVDEWADGTTSMYSFCLDIDLRSAFKRPHTQYDEQVIAGLARIDEIWKKTRGSPCRLFATHFADTVLLSVVAADSLVGAQEDPVRSLRGQDESSQRCAKDAVKAALSSGLIGRLGKNVQYQGYEAIKQEQLRHMHPVYANAVVTLIAAASKEPSKGLPGIPGHPKNQQPGDLVQRHALESIPPDPSLHDRSNLAWAT
ncbi:hypothetical protein FBULB1_12332 [Fusarium bulbicola]|nr:hypothetical protein FBULB1_12332 [Fusarium bulbicola]